MIKINSVVFDLGNVLIDWDPRYLYRKLIQTDEEVEWFLENICDYEWNLKHDSGQLFSKGILEKNPKIIQSTVSLSMHGISVGMKCLEVQ
jgi:2-haloacid dehalogenase